MSIIQLKIQLKYIKPSIFRTVCVDDNTTFSELHDIIQIAMGWENCHLYSFSYKDYFIEEFSEDDDMGFDFGTKKIDANNIKLSEVFTEPKDKVNYEYDFGDGWQHEIVFQKTIEHNINTNYPVCIKGARNCPPEDCGGFGAYFEIVELMKLGKGKQYKEMKEWLGGKYDPEEFDIDSVNETLQLYFN